MVVTSTKSRLWVIGYLPIPKDASHTFGFETAELDKLIDNAGAEPNDEEGVSTQ